MDYSNVPNSEFHAVIHFKARKIALLELHAQIIEHNLTETYQITGLINNLVEELDEELNV